MTKLQNIRGVAFDLDGTLVDSAPGLTDAVDMALYALELPPAGESRVVTWIGNGADVLMERALKWSIQEDAALKAAGNRPVAAHEPPPESVRLAMMRRLFDRYYAERVEEGSFLFPDVEQTLADLHQQGYPLGLVTNKPTPFVRPLLEALNIAHYFDVIIGGDDVQQKKPHPEALHHVLARFELAPEQLLFVGDSRNDILAAKAAGCPNVGLTYGYNYGEPISFSEPNYVFDRFNELLPALGHSHNEQQESNNE